MSRFELLGCITCGGNKDRTTHSFGKYRVYFNSDIIKLRCCTCNYVIKYRIIRGGCLQNEGEDDTIKCDICIER